MWSRWSNLVWMAGMLACESCGILPEGSERVRTDLSSVQQPKGGASPTLAPGATTRVSVLCPLRVERIRMTDRQGKSWLPQGIEGAAICPTRVVALEQGLESTESAATGAAAHSVEIARGSGVTMSVLGPAIEVSPTRYSDAPASPEAQPGADGVREEQSANKTEREFFLLSPRSSQRGPREGEVWILGQRSIRDFLGPESQVGLRRGVAFFEGRGEHFPNSYFTHAYTLAQLESLVGTIIDAAIERGTASGVAQIVGHEFAGIAGSTHSGIDAKLDVVILANLSKLGGDALEPLLLQPFFGLETQTATVSLRVKGLGRVNYDHSEIAHPHEVDVVHYSGLYELTVSIRADVVMYPLGYPCPGTLECELKGQLLAVANRDASIE